MLLLAAIAFSLPSCQYLKQKFSLGEYSLKAAIEWAKKDSARVADSLKKVIADKKNFERTLTDSLMSIKTSDTRPSKSGPHYYIIIGSFSSHENAENAVRQYSAEGYGASIVRTSNWDDTKLELVSIKTFSDKNEAAVFLRQYQDDHDPEAWLYTVK